MLSFRLHPFNCPSPTFLPSSLQFVPHSRILNCFENSSRLSLARSKIDTFLCVCNSRQFKAPSVRKQTTRPIEKTLPFLYATKENLFQGCTRHEMSLWPSKMCRAHSICSIHSLDWRTTAQNFKGQYNLISFIEKSGQQTNTVATTFKFNSRSEQLVSSHLGHHKFGPFDYF